MRDQDRSFRVSTSINSASCPLPSFPHRFVPRRIRPGDALPGLADWPRTGESSSPRSTTPHTERPDPHQQAFAGPGSSTTSPLVRSSGIEPTSAQAATSPPPPTKKCSPPPDLTGNVLVDTVQAHEGSQDEELGVERSNGSASARRGRFDIEPHRGRRDGLDFKLGERTSRIGGNGLVPLPADVQLIKLRAWPCQRTVPSGSQPWQNSPWLRLE